MSDRLGRFQLAVDMSTPLYALRVPEVYQALETTASGLNTREAEQRLLLYGANILFEPRNAPQWLRFIGHSTHPMALLLWVAALFSVLTGGLILGVFMGGVVLLNATFSFWQEYRAEQAIQALRRLLPAYARVLRDGEERQVPANQLVPGDVLTLAEGDNIPADARLVEEYGLRVNNATLTGEAMPARKTADASLHEGLTEVERPNLVFTGTSVVSGTGRAVVYATGMVTQFGRIANLTQAVREEPSLLLQDLKRVTKVITILALILGVLVLLVSILELRIPEMQAFFLGIGMVVAIVPEGLLPTVTLTLAMAVQRLARRGVLVKKLAVVETLGTTSVICTDKSGTLTQNQMTVREFWTSGRKFTVGGAGYEPHGDFSPSPAESGVSADVNALLTASLLCNNARLLPPSPGHPQWGYLGDQTEAALRVLAFKGGLDEQAVNASLVRVHELPFDARRKRMSTIHRPASASSWLRDEGTPAGEVAFVKGAPKEVLQLCSHILLNGEVQPLTEALRVQIMKANDDYARNVLRVLALARRELPTRQGAYRVEEVERDLTFLGLVGMMDPPRPDVAEAIRLFRGAGIRIVMITGDYGLTAESMARRIGMLSTPHPLILTGAELDEMEDVELQELLADEVILARMAPEHKLRLVAAFQERGEVVAVIGDGVNDAPALRKADVGIAMGLSGTDVAKEAADVVLTGDNFAAVAYAIEEGRAVYDNLRKFITYIFASNVPEVVPFILMSLFHIPLALTVTQILAIDLGTDLLPALGLGIERPEPDVMERSPRRRGQPLIDRSLLRRALWLGSIETVLCYAGFFLVFAQNGYSDFFHLPRMEWIPFAQRLLSPEGRTYILATTAFHAGVVLSQIGNAFACRTEKGKVRNMGWFSNSFLLMGVSIEAVLMVALIYVPPLAVLFEHLPLPAPFLAGLASYGVILYLLEWIRKQFVRRKKDEITEVL